MQVMELVADAARKALAQGDVSAREAYLRRVRDDAVRTATGNGTPKDAAAFLANSFVSLVRDAVREQDQSVTLDEAPAEGETRRGRRWVRKFW
jgi:hypothetical protein